jgi:hypothetical protein
MQSHVEQAGLNDADQLRQPLADSVLGTDADKTPESMQQMINAEIASRFLALNSEKNNGAFERLNRYETRLWRQVGQLLVTLEFLRRYPPS